MMLATAAMIANTKLPMVTPVEVLLPLLAGAVPEIGGGLSGFGGQGELHHPGLPLR